ncbi:MAG: coxB [Holophagaceae bacterium]|nr:coxB [Holophagaceae bacterium]
MDWMTQASTSAQRSDLVFLAVLGISVLVLLIITLAMIYFVIRYSRKRHPVADQIEGSTPLEITWTVITGAIFLAIFYFGWTNFDYMRSAPRDSMVVEATGRQWSWSFKYPNGKQTGVLYAVLGKPMKVEIRSADVIHGFFVPAFRLKMDAVPGRVNTTWFEPTKLGAFDIECTVICGVSHSVMLSKVVVVSEDEFKAWYFGDESAPEPGRKALAQGSTAPPQAMDPGIKVMQANDCLSCHSLDGTPMVAPTFKGMLGRKEEILIDGKPRQVVVDEAQIRKAILDPQAQPVRGYPPSMPPYALDAKDLDAVVATIKGAR